VLDPAKNPGLFLALFFPAFAGIWCLTCYLLSKMSGWQALAATLQLYGSFFDKIRPWVDPAKVHDILNKGGKP